MPKIRSAERNTQNSTSICRICHLEEDEARVLYQPCRCMGTIGSVHEHCLRHWMQLSKHNHCEVCSYKYKFTRAYSIWKYYGFFVPIFWHTFKQYCSDKFCALLKFIICYFLTPLLIADFVLLIFQQQHHFAESAARPFYKLCLGNAMCGFIVWINYMLKQLSNIMLSCPKLCCAAAYKPGQMNGIQVAVARLTQTQTEKGLTGVGSYFIRTLTCHLTFIAAYMYMPYLLVCNLSKLHADNLAKVLSVYFFTPAIIRLVCTLTLVFKLKKIRLHCYVYGLYIKVIFLLSWHYLLLPLLSGIAINCTAWLLLEQSVPKLGSIQIVWQCVKCYVTGFLFNNNLEENLCVISRYLEKSYNFMKCDAVLAMARTDFSQQLRRACWRVCYLAVALLAIVWLPVYILSRCDERQQQTLQFLYAFYCIRAAFRKLLKASKTKKRLLQACCKIMQNTVLKRNFFKQLLGLLVCGSVLLSVFCVQLLLIHELGWYLSEAYNVDKAYSYVYGSCMYYMLQLVLQKLRCLKWRHLSEFMLLLRLLACTLPIVYLFAGVASWPFRDAVEFGYLQSFMIGMVPLLLVGYFMFDAHNGRFLRNVRLIWQLEFKNFMCKLVLLVVQAMVFYICTGTYKLDVLVKWPYLDILYSIYYLLTYMDLCKIHAAMKELRSPYEYKSRLQNYKKNKDYKYLIRSAFKKFKLKLTNFKK